MRKKVTVIEPEVLMVDSNNQAVSKKRVCAYCRVSTELEEQQKSFDAQVSEFQQRIQQNPNWEFAGIFADRGISGTQAKKRVQFQQMLLACRTGKVDLILTKSISRFARNVVDCVETVRNLKEMGVEVYFEKENLYTFDSKAEFLLTILASIAQEESRNISQNSTWGIRKRMKDGIAVVNCSRFLGYDKDENGNLIINPEEAKIVQRIFREYLEGKGCSKIAKELEQDGIKTVTGCSRWAETTVKGILANEKYYGKLLLQKTVTIDFLTHKRVDNNNLASIYCVENNHEPIVSKEMWDRVQAERERRFKLTAGKNSNKAKYLQRYPFSGKLICGHCGETLKRRHWNTSGTKERIVWQCITYIQRKASFCPTKGVGEATIEAAFVDVYNRVIQDKSSFFDEFFKIISRTLVKSDRKSDFTKLSKKITALEKELKELIKMRTQRQIDDACFNVEADERKQKLHELIEERDKLADSQISLVEQNLKMERIKAAIHNNANPLSKFDPHLFQTVIEKVVIHSPIEFTFCFQGGVQIKIDAEKYHDGRKMKKSKK